MCALFTTSSSLGRSSLINAHLMTASGMNRNFASTSAAAITGLDAFDDEADDFTFEQWTSNVVTEWLKGLDDLILPFIGLLKRSEITGKKLVVLNEERLQRVGVTKELVRRLILQACQLLIYYAYDRRSENAQKLAMKIYVSVQSLMSAISLATPVINSNVQSSRAVSLLSTVLVAVAELHEDVMRLIFWLDRPPFDDKKEFIDIREQLATLIREMIDCINDPNNPRFFSVPQLLVEKGSAIQDVAKRVLASADPHVLDTAYMQRVGMVSRCKDDWGIKIRRTSEGVHLVTQVYGADVNRRISVGDELVEVNRRAVVGWKAANVVRRMSASAKSGARGYEIEVVLCKRPHHSWSSVTALQKTPADSSRVVETDDEEDKQKSIIWDFKHKIQPDLLVRGRTHEMSSPLAATRGRSASVSDEYELRRRRSFDANINSKPSTAAVDAPTTREESGCRKDKSPSLMMVGERRPPLFRRASVWSESPPAVLRSPFDRLHAAESNAWLLLLASWGNGPRSRHGSDASTTPSSVSIPSTTRVLPRMLVPNRAATIVEEDEDPISTLVDYDDALAHRASISLVQDLDLGELRVRVDTAEDSDWASPAIEDITGCKLTPTRAHLESSSSQSNVDSPLSNIQAKITKFFYGSDTSSDMPPQQQVPTPSYSSSSNVMSTSLSSDKPDSGPLTPLKLAQDLVFPVFKQQNSPQQPLCSPVKSESSPSINRSISPHTPLSRVMNVVALRRTRLAPLAEPDDSDHEDRSASLLVASPESVMVDQVTAMPNPPIASLRQLAELAADALSERWREGWIRRQKLAEDYTRHSTKHDSQWIKCWAALTTDRFFCYSKKEANRADIVFDLRRCELISGTSIRTSKRNTFTLKWADGELCFATFKNVDLLRWLQSIGERKTALKATSHMGESSDTKQSAVCVRIGEDASSISSTTSASSETSTLAASSGLLGRINIGRASTRSPRPHARVERVMRTSRSSQEY